MASANKLSKKSSAELADDRFDETYKYEDLYDEFDDFPAIKHTKPTKLYRSRNTKRRLDNYKEQKWLKEHSWFDDDIYPE